MTAGLLLLLAGCLVLGYGIKKLKARERVITFDGQIPLMEWRRRAWAKRETR